MSIGWLYLDSKCYYNLRSAQSFMKSQDMCKVGVYIYIEPTLRVVRISNSHISLFGFPDRYRQSPLNWVVT